MSKKKSTQAKDARKLEHQASQKAGKIVYGLTGFIINDKPEFGKGKILQSYAGQLLQVGGMFTEAESIFAYRILQAAQKALQVADTEVARKLAEQVIASGYHQSDVNTLLLNIEQTVADRRSINDWTVLLISAWNTGDIQSIERILIAILKRDPTNQLATNKNMDLQQIRELMETAIHAREDKNQQAMEKALELILNLMPRYEPALTFNKEIIAPS